MGDGRGRRRRRRRELHQAGRRADLEVVRKLPGPLQDERPRSGKSRCPNVHRSDRVCIPER